MAKVPKPKKKKERKKKTIAAASYNDSSDPVIAINVMKGADKLSCHPVGERIQAEQIGGG